MPVKPLSDDAIREIWRLHAASKSPGEIARILHLHRLEVTSVLAFEPGSVSAGPASDDTAKRRINDGGEQDEDASIADGDSMTEVERVLVDEIDEPSDEQGDIYLGEEIDISIPIEWQPTNSRRVTNAHLMIMGESGSGKTYATQAIVAELAHAGIPSIIFDYGQGFEPESLHPIFRERFAPKQYRIGEDGLPLNPLSIAPGTDVHGPRTVAMRLADVFDASFQLGPIQKKALIDAVLHLYASVGIERDDKASWSKPAPKVRQLQDVIEELAADKAYPGARNAAGLSARLTPFFMLSSFTDVNWSWEQLLDSAETKVHVLQFRGLEGKTQRVLVEMLLWHMFYHLKSHGVNALRLFCVLDEAHTLSFREGGPLGELLRQARKFGLGVILASQQPEDFSSVAYSNTASKLIFRTADPKLRVSKNLAGKAAQFEKPEDIRNAVSDLPRADALFISAGRGNLVHIADFPRRVTLWRKGSSQAK